MISTGSTSLPAATGDGDLDPGVEQSALLECAHLTKSYGHVLALVEVDLRINGGEVVALVGDNGAGKSTLVKIISGVFPPDAGEVRIRGEQVRLRSPSDARSRGIETVYQHLALAEQLAIWKNIFLGREMRRPGPLGRIGWLDKKSMRTRADDELRKLGIVIPNVDVLAARLSGGQRQAVAVARSVTWGRSVVALDEPTANLGVQEQDRVRRLIGFLAERNIGVLLVSHNLEEVFNVADRIVVLRHGHLIAEARTQDVSKRQVVEWITGAASAAQ